MSGRVCYVAGGTGIVGSGITRSLLDAGHKVWISSRNENKLNEFKNALPADLQSRLGTITGEISNEADCAKVRDQILSVDKTVHHVVTSLGSWWQKGLLSDQSVEEFFSVITDFAASHFVVYKTFAKILAAEPNSTFTFITGGSGEECEKGRVFLADASLIPVASSSVYGLYDGAFSEFNNHPNLKISQLRIFLWVRPKPDSNFDANASQSEAGNDFVGRFIPRIIKKHRNGIFRVKTRSEANLEFEKI